MTLKGPEKLDRALIALATRGSFSEEPDTHSTSTVPLLEPMLFVMVHSCR